MGSPLTDSTVSPSRVHDLRSMKHHGLYYGWKAAAALFMCTFAVFGVSVYSFIVLTQPLAAQFGWSPAQTGSLVSAMWLVAPLAFLSGAVAKLSKPWRLVMFGLLIEAGVLVAMIFVTEFWQLYLLRILMGVGKVAAIVVVPLIVSQWFSRRFATAMALVWAGGSAGGLFMSPLTEAMSSTLGWKATAVTIAGGLLIAALAAGWFSRGPSSPAELNLSPDGDSATTELNQAASSVATSGRANWRNLNFGAATFMFVAIVGGGMGAIAILAQQPTFLQRAGLSSAASAMMLGITAAGCTAGSASIGWMLDRFHGVWSSLVVLSSLALGLLILALLPETTARIVLSVVGSLSLGYAVGAAEVLWIALTKRQFGETLFPITYGGWYFAIQLGYAIGGGLGGLGLERLGQGGFLLIVAAMYLPAAICSLTIKGARQPAPAMIAGVQSR
jgi:predicted MFS family arabinose efflux permease